MCLHIHTTVSLHSYEYSKNNRLCKDKIHYITMILHWNYINRKKKILIKQDQQYSDPKACIALKVKSISQINKKKWSKKFYEKKKKKKKKKFFFFFFCENEKLDDPRYLGDFYYRGTMNVPCIRESTSICNWVTFYVHTFINWRKLLCTFL